MMPHCFLVTGIAICRVPITVLGTETRKPSSACKPSGEEDSAVLEGGTGGCGSAGDLRTLGCVCGLGGTSRKGA